MNGVSEEFSMGELKADVRAIKDSIAKIEFSLSNFGQRTGKAENDISKLDGKMDIVLTIGRWIFAPVFSVMGVGTIMIVAWYLLRK